MTYLQLLALALAPGVAILLYLYFRDPSEREPPRVILRTFCVGALVALPVLALNVLLLEPLRARLGISGFWSTLWEAFVSAGFTEEFLKYAGVLLSVYWSPNLNEPYDGIVYASALSLGFATLENVVFVFTGGFATAWARAFLTVPGHALFGIAMGYYLGRARFAPRLGQRLQLWALALLVPAGMHGAYDLLALHADVEALFYLLVPLMGFFFVRGARQLDAAVRASRPPGPGAPLFGDPCPHCGTRVLTSARYCHHCGIPLRKEALADCNALAEGN